MVSLARVKVYLHTRGNRQRFSLAARSIMLTLAIMFMFVVPFSLTVAVLIQRLEDS